MITQRLILDVRAVGEPKGQPRPRAFIKKGKGGTQRASVYEAGTAENWKSCVATACKSLEGAALAAPLMVSLTFYFPRPAGHFSKSKLGGLLAKFLGSLFTKKPDIDNAAKAVLDALTGIGAWIDDALVTDQITRKRFTPPGTAPGCRIQIYELTETIQ
jgi:Holliday junction resolvase RusA-like endonuclease